MSKKQKDKVKINKKKRSGEAVLKKNKPSVLLRYLIMALQALCGAVIGICFLVYNATARLTYITDYATEHSTAYFYDVSNDYFESDVYTNNLSQYSKNLLRYVTICEQMEENGAYFGKKEIDVGEFANRYEDVPYEGPIVKYYLDDLISWGQKASLDSFSYCLYDFYTADEYCEFFGIDISTLTLPEGYDPDQPLVSFETLKNIYQTVDGLNAEDYVDNENDYLSLISDIQNTASDLYFNYMEYQRFKIQFDAERTNFRFYVSFTDGGRKSVFTNEPSFYKGIAEKYVEDHFKAYGEYIYACPGKINYVTNTKVLYEVFKQGIVDNYSYAFPDDTVVYIAVDTDFPVKDLFSENNDIFIRTRNIIPWLVVIAASSIFIFVALFAFLVGRDRKNSLLADNKAQLSWFDKLPIEVSALFVIIFALILYLVEDHLFNGSTITDFNNNLLMFVSFAGFITFDLFVILLIIYSFIRRIIYKNVFEGSIYSIVSPHLSKATYGLRKWFWHVYDSAGVSIRTWAGYVCFLLINCFLTCFLFFSNYKLASFLGLFVFDLAVGVFLFNKNYERKKIVDGIKRINSGEYDYSIESGRMHGDNRELAEAVNNIGLGLNKALEISTKDERLKADLITNVSHDIKTPLTSIINYVDLLKRENIDNERVKKYINVLDEKSQRLKQLTFDLVEASKAASGNIQIDLIKIDFVEFLKQAVGEFEEKFSERDLMLVLNLPKTSQYAFVDPRHMWRVVENILNNVCKYALTGTRVYLDLVPIEEEGVKKLVLSLKNISNQQLNIPADELTERFIRGDVSRSTEGSGLGLSIAKNLTVAQKGEFNIYLDGDLFKVTITVNQEE